ncbi:MAG: hypothetical protein ACRDDZ_04080 [Marinifilaceae bacterium]
MNSNTELVITHLASQVLNGKIRNSDIVPVEIEIYVFSPCHRDDAAQRHPLQTRYNRFYFYRAGKSNSLRPLSRMGVGVSFSTDNESIAVLLRGIYCNGEYINGPSKVARYIYKFFTGAGMDSSHTKERLENIERIEKLDNVFQLEGSEVMQSIFRASRVGINKKKEYATACYRFLTHPNRIGYKEKQNVINQYLQDKYGIAELTDVKLHNQSIIEDIQKLFGCRIPRCRNNK